MTERTQARHGSEERESKTTQEMDIMQRARVMGNQAVMQRLPLVDYTQLESKIKDNYTTYSKREDAQGMCDSHVAAIIAAAVHDLTGETVEYKGDLLMYSGNSNIGWPTGETTRVLLFRKEFETKERKKVGTTSNNFQHVSFFINNASWGINQTSTSVVSVLYLAEYLTILCRLMIY